VTPLEVVLWIALGAVLITAWGSLLLYLDEKRQQRFERGRRKEDAAPFVPFIHLPRRSQTEDDLFAKPEEGSDHGQA
jgi:hypothetical protein